MRIAFAGAQSTGKTTLVERMRNDKRYSEYNVYTNTTRKISELGHSINKEGDIGTQSLIFNAHANMVLGDLHYISDRSPIDALAYSSYLLKNNRIHIGEYYVLTELGYNLAVKYDVIFYTPVEFDAVSDGVRDIDPEFRNYIDEKIHEILNDFEVKYVALTGSIEERLEVIRETVDRLEVSQRIKEHGGC